MGIQQLSLILSKSLTRQGLLQILCCMMRHPSSLIATTLEERLEERFPKSLSLSPKMVSDLNQSN